MTLEGSPSNRNKIPLGGLVFDNSLPIEEKVLLIARRYGIRSLALPRMLSDLQRGGDPINRLISIGGVKEVVRKFVEWHNLEDDNLGPKEGHKLFTNCLFSDSLLPLVSAIFSYGLNYSDRSAVYDASTALVLLNYALDIVHNNSGRMRNGLNNPVAVFTQMQADSVLGVSSDLQDFFTLMRLAKMAAKKCIEKHRNKPVEIDVNIKLPPGIEQGKKQTLFAALVQQAMAEFDSENGTKFPPDIVEIIKNSQALVISFDWNSTWTPKGILS